MEEKTVRPFGIKDKLGYMFGDFGNDFFFMLVMAYLMVFYTDIYGISPAFIGGLFLIARLWDALADITWGRFIDTRKTGKNGKFKPWIFRMSFPLVISGILMFVPIPGMSDGFYEAYAFVTYILWGTLYSTVNIPYGSMASVITSDPIERSTLSTFRVVGAMLASLIINGIGPLIVFVDNEINANRMFMAAVLFGVLSISCYMACVKLTTERIVIPEKVGEKSNLGQSLKGLIKNKPLITIVCASLLLMMCTMLIGTVNVYLFKDYFQNTAALSIAGILLPIATFIVAPAVKPLTVKFGKKEASAVGMIVAAAAYVLLYFLPDLEVTAFLVLSGIGILGSAFFQTTIYAFVTDVIDYHELMTGLREDATVYSIYSFARKVGQAIAGGIGGFAIAAVGYNSALKVQAENTLNGIYTLATLVPAVTYGLIFLILFFIYPMSKKRLTQMAIDLAGKRNK